MYYPIDYRVAMSRVRRRVLSHFGDRCRGQRNPAFHAAAEQRVHRAVLLKDAFPVPFVAHLYRAEILFVV